MLKSTINLRISSYSPPPPPSVFYAPFVTNYNLLYSTLLCKKLARAPGVHKKFMLTKLGAQNRKEPNLTQQTRSEKTIHNQIINLLYEINTQGFISVDLDGT